MCLPILLLGDRIDEKGGTGVRKFCVFSGFLGSGKTTAMMALTKLDGRTAMISNDLGGKGLADHRFARLSGCRASELTGECICYQTQNLVQRLEELFSEGCEIVISDIPGFGVGALEHVYHTLNQQYPGRYSLAPFTVLTEAYVLDRLEKGGDLAYILDAQLREADLIVLNKCDLLTPLERERRLLWLEKHFPQARVLAVSALTGFGLSQLYAALKEGSASLRRPDIGYGGKEFGAAMGKISEYNIQYHTVVCCDDFDGSAYLTALAELVRAGLGDYDIPHLKLLAWEPEGDFGKADFIGADRAVVLTRPFTHPVTELAVVLNASARCPAGILDDILTASVEEAASRFRLENSIFKKECFGMGGDL